MNLDGCDRLFSLQLFRTLPVGKIHRVPSGLCSLSIFFFLFYSTSSAYPLQDLQMFVLCQNQQIDRFAVNRGRRHRSAFRDKVTAKLSLSAVREVKEAVPGATVNDVPRAELSVGHYLRDITRRRRFLMTSHWPKRTRVPELGHRFHT